MSRDTSLVKSKTLLSHSQFFHGRHQLFNHDGRLPYRWRYPHYRPWRPTGDVEARVHILTATALGWGRVASPTLGRLYPQGNSPYSFYWRSGHEGVKKTSTPPTPGIKPGCAVRCSAPCRLSHLALRPTLCSCEFIKFILWVYMFKILHHSLSYLLSLPILKCLKIKEVYQNGAP